MARSTRAAWMYISPSSTSLIVRSCRTKVGFFWLMLEMRTCSRWLDSGRTVLLNHTMPSASRAATTVTGATRRGRWIPLAFMAVISLSPAIRLKA